MSSDKILYRLRTRFDFNEPIFVFLCAFFHPGKSATRIRTKRTPKHAGILPTVYLESRAGRACVDYDSKTA